MSRTRLLVILLLMVGGGACGDDGGSTTDCGDGICSTAESPADCQLDCSYECVPATQRCVGNRLAVCQSDGLHELALDCQPGQYCEGSTCVEIRDAGTDTVSDQGDGSGDETRIN